MYPLDSFYSFRSNLLIFYGFDRKHSITYSTPMMQRWTTQRMIPLQAKNIEKNRVLLFIITKDSLDIASMILVSSTRLLLTLRISYLIVLFNYLVCLLRWTRIQGGAVYPKHRLYLTYLE